MYVRLSALLERMITLDRIERLTSNLGSSKTSKVNYIGPQLLVTSTQMFKISILTPITKHVVIVVQPTSMVMPFRVPPTQQVQLSHY